MTQRYTDSGARYRMRHDLCPECGTAAVAHKDVSWRICTLTPAGVTDRIAAYREEVASDERNH